MLTIGGATAPAQAATSTQCNAVGGGGGQGYDCSVEITNLYDVATGLGSSTVRTIACNGPANTDPLPTCTDSGILPVAELTNIVDQCNGAVGGNGGSLYCSVSMINTIIGDATVADATVNQCVGSLGGGGTVEPSVCDPVQSTTGATVTQCNGSVNGGGGRMNCTVGPSTTNSAFPVSVTQCNGSAEGTGNLMECSTSITTIIQPAETDGGDTGGGGSDGGTGGGTDGGGAGDGTGGGTGAGTGGGGGPVAERITGGELAATGPGETTAALLAIAIALLLSGACAVRLTGRSTA